MPPKEFSHLFLGLDQMSDEAKSTFLAELSKYPSDLIQRQKEALFHSKFPPTHITPPEQFDSAGNSGDRKLGEALLKQGKVGCILLAGGQGTRLGLSGPKGCTQVTLFKQKTLFQFFCEKTRAASKQAGVSLPLAIMTSPLNHKETLTYLNSEERFGLSSAQLNLFTQSLLPLLDDRGNWMLEEIGKLAEAPDGNGEALHHFLRSDIWKKWKQKGIEYLTVVLIDNPLADPFDAELIGYHARNQNEITLKCIERENPQEHVGIIATSGSHLKVVEYSEMSELQKAGKKADGSLLFPLANISLFCFSASFIEQIQNVQLPWHFARKEAKTLIGTPRALHQTTTKVWKCETFIFDLLDLTERAKPLVYPREQCFAPLKNRSGDASLESLREALLAFDRNIYTTITGIDPKQQSFELDPAFYYPSEKLLAKWKGKKLPLQGYIPADD